MVSAGMIQVIEDKGIVGNHRYFDRRNPSTGESSPRQVTLIEREQIGEHAVVLGLEKIAPGAVRANIETFGVDLVALVGQQIEIGEAILLVHQPRQPCAKMDAICQGLRALMQSNRQGVLAQVIRSGHIPRGASIKRVVPMESAGP